MGPGRALGAVADDAAGREEADAASPRSNGELVVREVVRKQARSESSCDSEVRVRKKKAPRARAVDSLRVLPVVLERQPGPVAHCSAVYPATCIDELYGRAEHHAWGNLAGLGNCLFKEVRLESRVAIRYQDEVVWLRFQGFVASSVLCEALLPTRGCRFHGRFAFGTDTAQPIPSFRRLNHHPRKRERILSNSGEPDCHKRPLSKHFRCGRQSRYIRSERSSSSRDGHSRCCFVPKALPGFHDEQRLPPIE